MVGIFLVAGREEENEPPRHEDTKKREKPP
jgi:hypothetical protein